MFQTTQLAIDVLDQFAYSLIGHKKENKFTAKSRESDLLVAGIGITPYNKPFIHTKSDFAKELSLEYKVNKAGSFVVIVIQSGWYDLDIITIPTGFTKVVNQQGLDSYETSCIAVNSSQDIGTYTVYVEKSDEYITGISIAVYIFPPDNYIYTYGYAKGTYKEIEKTLILDEGYDQYIFSAGDGEYYLSVIVECPLCGEYYNIIDFLDYIGYDYYDYYDYDVSCLICGYNVNNVPRFIGVSV